MRINGYAPPRLPDLSDAGGDLAVEDAIDGELLAQSHNQMKAEGAAALSLIDGASDIGVNKPLSWGPVGRTINVKA